MKNLTTHLLKNIPKTVLGIFLAGFGVKGFLIPNNFIDGGVTGVSMLVSELTHTNLSLLVLLFNAPFVLLGFQKINRNFASGSLLSILGFAAALYLIPYPVITQDKLLASVFGGAFLGAGIGLSIRGSAVLDGTEILALVLSKRVGITVGEIILVLNVIIFSVCAITIGLETALYSMLTYASASKMLDFFLHGLEEYNGITVISGQSQQIKEAIITQTDRGVTIYKGQGGKSGDEMSILFCVVTRLEVPRIKSIVQETDPEAFLVVHNLKDASGGMVKQRLRH